MKSEKQQRKIITNANIPNKQLNVTIFFRDRFALMKILRSIADSVHLGVQYKSEEINNDFYEYDLKYSEKYDYEKRIIDGKLCHVFKSRL